MFERLIHADWSTHPAKKWMAVAARSAPGWEVEAPRLVPSSPEFLDRWLLDGRSVLAGFDFPIGLPFKYGNSTGFRNYLEALANFGEAEWDRFYVVAGKPEDISTRRPFYPASSRGQPRQAHLLSALVFTTIDDLRRLCEQKTATRRAACSMFWTVGANQVGKAVIDGWQSVIRPALNRGAGLWPFQGGLTELSKSSNCILCETYPQEAYSHVGIQFAFRGGGKSSQQARRTVGESILTWADRHSVNLTDNARDSIKDGFGASGSGEDQFDALVGLISMIEVVEGKRPEGGTAAEKCKNWEGWILGQNDRAP
jgi:hypothetical protein